MANILMVGTATLDLVFGLDRYPAADDEMRAQSLRTVRGGNAANSAIVLSQLGHRVEFLGTLADAPETSVITGDFDRYGVGYRHCPRLPGKPPTSSIYLSAGARSIVHYRDLPELPAEAIDAVDLGQFDRVHFEGRNIEAVAAMMRRARQHGLPVSLELEKNRPQIELLYPLANLIVSSSNFAAGRPAEFMRWLQEQAPQADLVLAAGSDGAYGLDAAGLQRQPAMPPQQLVDTLGAGDTFNAGLLGAASRGLAMAEMLRVACSLAGYKCGVAGFDIAAWPALAANQAG